MLDNKMIELVKSYCSWEPSVYEIEAAEQPAKRKLADLINRFGDDNGMRLAISEKVVQRCLCDNALVPAMQRTFVYDNGASVKGKGYTFAVNRITEHLHRHYRKYGQDGYILIFDFSKFFDNISHELVKRMIRKEFTDERIISLSDYSIDAFGVKGLGLGSQISQVLALASANKLDHFVKEILRIKSYARYSDDGYLIHPSKEYLHKCLDAITALCNELNITLNTKKTQIIKLSHGFTWLKIRFFLTKTGKVIRKICKKSITKQRRKLKKLRKKLDEGKIEYMDVVQSFQSWRSHSSNFNAYHTIKNMEKLYNQLFYKEINIWCI